MPQCFLWNWSMQLSQWKIALNRIWPFPGGSTFVFIRLMWATVTVNNYNLSAPRMWGSRTLPELQRELQHEPSRSSVSVISAMWHRTSSVSARGLLNTFNIVSGKVPVPPPSFHYSCLTRVYWRSPKNCQGEESHPQKWCRLESGHMSTRRKCNWYFSCAFICFWGERNGVPIPVFRDCLPLTVWIRCRSVYPSTASAHSWINEMPVLWDEDGRPVWIDSDTGTFVLCAVLCACWIGGRIGVDGSRIGGKEATGCRPLGQSLKAAKCHKFRTTFITRGSRDYRGWEISCVLANKNLDLRPAVVGKSHKFRGNNRNTTWSLNDFYLCMFLIDYCL